MLGTILTWVLPIVTALPSLIAGVETLWHNTPKSGAQKWISVEQSISSSVVLAANTIAKTVPNVDVDKVSTSVAKLSKAVNDAFVLFLNEIGYFTHSTAPSTGGQS